MKDDVAISERGVTSGECQEIAAPSPAVARRMASASEAVNLLDSEPIQV